MEYLSLDIDMVACEMWFQQPLVRVWWVQPDFFLIIFLLVWGKYINQGK